MKIDNHLRSLTVLTAFFALTLTWGILVPNYLRERSSTRALIEGIEASKVNTIEFSNGGIDYKLVRKGTLWELNSKDLNVRIETTMVDEAISLVLKSRTRRLVSETGKGSESLGFDGTASTLRFFDVAGLVLAELQFGKGSATGTDSFVRLGQGQAVYTTDPTLSVLARKEPGSWVSTKVWSIQELKGVSWFEVQRNEQTERYTFNPETKTWAGTGNDAIAKLETGAIESVVRHALTLEGEKPVALDDSQVVELFSGLEKRVVLSFGFASPESVELWAKPGAEVESFFVKFLKPRKTLDNRNLIIELATWKVGDLAKGN